MGQSLLHQMDLPGVAVQGRGEEVARDMWWPLLDYLRTPQTDPHNLDWLHLPESITSQ